MATTWTTGGANANRGATGVSSMGGTMKYGSLDETEAFKIQKKFLSIAKRSMIMARFAQKETKAQKEGLDGSVLKNSLYLSFRWLKALSPQPIRCSRQSSR